MKERNGELYGARATTRVILNERQVAAKYEHYNVYYESVRKVRGRLYEGITFDQFYQKNEFSAYMYRDGELLICSGPKKTSKSFIDYLNKEAPDVFNADYMRLDFQKLRPRFQEINGVWVSLVTVPFVNTLALFGSNVDKSELFRMAEALGVASSMLIAYSYQGQTWP